MTGKRFEYDQTGVADLLRANGYDVVLVTDSEDELTLDDAFVTDDDYTRDDVGRFAPGGGGGGRGDGGKGGGDGGGKGGGKSGGPDISKPYTWEKTADGYRASDGRAELIKSGKTWKMKWHDGRTFDMPKRASFDHAESIMGRLATEGAASDSADDEGFVIDDGATLEKAEVTDSGFLRAPANITKTGVLIYINPDGSERRELRLPEEVFAEDSLRTLRLAPLTREHPKPLGTPVTARNRRELSIGVVDSDARPAGAHGKAGPFLRATVQVEDTAGLEDVATDTRRELSAGYRRRLERTPGVTKGIPGVPDGLRYDGIQRNIRYNHVALTRVGRAGPDARLLLDSEASVMVCDASERQEHEPAPQAQGQQATETSNMKRKIKLGGITYEIDCEDSAFEAVTKHIADTEAKITSLDSQLADVKKTSEAQVADLKKTVETESARASKAEGALKTAEKIVADSLAPEKVQEMVKARLELERKVAPLLVDAKGQQPDLSSLANEDIKRKVVLAVDPDAKLDNVDSAFLDGSYGVALKALTAAKSKDATGKLRAASNPVAAAGGGGDSKVVTDAVEKAKQDMRAWSEGAWRGEAEQAAE